jgi:hypothetical protein
MIKPRPLLITALVVLALGSPLRADFIAWSYSTSSPTSPVMADSPGTGSVIMTGGTGSAVGNSQIVVANLQVSSMDSIDHLTTNGAYQINVSLTDTASSQNGTVSLTGQLSGTFSSASSNLGNSFVLASKTIDLGGNAYTVTLDSYLPPGPPTATRLGAIGAFVSVSALPPGGNPGPSGFGTPEPSTLLLCSLGAVSCALAGFRRRRLLAARGQADR